MTWLFRRYPIPAAALIAAVVGQCFVACGAGPSVPAQPNIIVILTDDQGYGDVGVHGNDKIRTPHLDRFAREGVELTRFYVSPVCAPTRASLLTGRYYYRSGVVHTSRGGAKMHGGETTIAEMLREEGYRTGIFGKWHLGDNYPMRPIDQGFDEALVHKSGGINQSPDKPNGYFDPLLWKNGERFKASGYCTDVFFNAALSFIEANRERPFFVYLPTNAPHTPLIVAEEYSRPYLAMGLDETTAKVYGMVENIDDNFGALLGKLDEWGLSENTLIAFISDNGPQQDRYNAGLRGRKSSVYEGGIRALSFWRWPRGFQSAAKVGRIAAHIDVAPTLLEVARVAEKAGAAASDARGFDGVSLAPLLRGDGAAWPERTLFFQCHRGLEPQPYQNAAVLTPRFKLIAAPGTFNREDLKLPEEPPLELYDVASDPGEENNIAEQHPDIVAELRKQYDAWFEDVRSSRGFTPGVIHLGSAAEPDAVLCRYQDSTYKKGKPTTWPVEIERAGRYELTALDDEIKPGATMHVELNGEQMTQVLAGSPRSAVFELPAGKAEIDIWIENPGEGRVLATVNSTRGDIGVRGPL